MASARVRTKKIRKEHGLPKSKPIAGDADDMADVIAAGASVREGYLVQLGELVNEYIALESEMTALLEQAEARNKELLDLKLHRLPDVMKAAQIEHQRMTSGHEVSLKTKVRASFPADPIKRARAIEALTDLNGLDLIKHVISLSFDRDEQEKAQASFEFLRVAGLAPDNKQAIHAGTYAAWVNELLDDEKMAPKLLARLDDLGVFMQDIAEVKAPKSKRKEKKHGYAEAAD